MNHIAGSLHIGVGVLLFREGKILLGQRRGSHGAGEWAAPGGHLEYDETPEQCALRELDEETGLTARALYAGPWTWSRFPERQRQYATLFIMATAAPGDAECREPDKCAGWQWFAPDALPQPLFAPLASFVARYGVAGFDPQRWAPLPLPDVAAI